MSKDTDGANQQTLNADDDASPPFCREMRPSVSFASDVSVFEEDSNDSNTLATSEDDDLLPTSIFSGRWIGDISTSDASRGVALVEINDNVLKLPFQHSEQVSGIRKRLSPGAFDTSKSVTEIEHTERSLESPPKSINGNSSDPTFAFEGSSTGRSLESPLTRINANNSEHVSPLKSPVSPLSESNDLRLLNSGFQAQDDDDSEIATRMWNGSSHSLDSGPTSRRCKMWARVVNRMRAVLIFVGYAAVVAGAPLCGNRLFLGLKLIGAFVLCCLASVSTTHLRRTELSEIVCSRKTFLLVIYIVAWTNVVNAAAGLWSARLADKMPITGNETAWPAWQKTLHEILAQDAPPYKTDTNAVTTHVNEDPDHEIEVETITPEITRVSESLDEEEAEVDAVELTDTNAVITDVKEAADHKIEVETITPEITRVSESLDKEVAEVDAVELTDTNVEITDVNEAADHKIEVETITPEITRVSKFLDEEEEEVNAVELADTNVEITDVNEAADHTIEVETINPKITRVSGSLDEEVAEVDAVALTDTNAVITDVNEAADHKIEVETITPEITRVSESLDEEVAEVDAVELTDANAVITDVNEAAYHKIEVETITPEITRISESLDEEVAEVDAVEFKYVEDTSEDIQTDAQESIISLHFEKEMNVMNRDQKEVAAAEAEVDIITPETAHVLEPEISPLIEERYAVDDAGSFENQAANIKASPGTERELNVFSPDTEEVAAAANDVEAETITPETAHISEPRISPIIDEREALVIEFDDASVAAETEEDLETSYPANETTGGEAESSGVASIIAAEAASESEANNVDVDNELDTDSANEIASSDIEDSSLDAGGMNIAETDRIGPASEGACGELEASHEARATYRETDTVDQLSRRKRSPRFSTPFFPKSWMKDPMKREQTSRFGTYLFSVPTWETPLSSMSGDGTAVNKHVHFVAISAVSRLAKGAVWHCTAFLIGVDGKYKNQVMMDTLSEIWTSRFFI